MPRLRCPSCGREIDRFDQPRLTVDAVVIDATGRVLLIERGHPPEGWALPGGFVDSGETLQAAAHRELLEETSMTAENWVQFHTYSDPERDPRHHTVATVFLAEGTGTPVAGDDARDAKFYDFSSLPAPLAFDHARILEDIARFLATGLRPGDLPQETP